MEKLTNIVSLDDLKNQDQEDGMSWNDYIDSFKDGVDDAPPIFKGVIFARRRDGTYTFVCTESNKIGQERLLYHVQDVIKIYINQYPDFELMKETAELEGKNFDDVIDENYDIEPWIKEED